MPEYNCERCLKDFKQKSHYDKHLNKKIPCQNIKEKVEIEVEKVISGNEDKEVNNKKKTKKETESLAEENRKFFDAQSSMNSSNLMLNICQLKSKLQILSNIIKRLIILIAYNKYDISYTFYYP